MIFLTYKNNFLRGSRGSSGGVGSGCCHQADPHVLVLCWASPGGAAGQEGRPPGVGLAVVTKYITKGWKEVNELYKEKALSVETEKL